jgi:hypothetical protein
MSRAHPHFHPIDGEHCVLRVKDQAPLWVGMGNRWGTQSKEKSFFKRQFDEKSPLDRRIRDAAVLGSNADPCGVSTDSRKPVTSENVRSPGLSLLFEVLWDVVALRETALVWEQKGNKASTEAGLSSASPVGSRCELLAVAGGVPL